VESRLTPDQCSSRAFARAADCTRTGRIVDRRGKGCLPGPTDIVTAHGICRLGSSADRQDERGLELAPGDAVANEARTGFHGSTSFEGR